MICPKCGFNQPDDVYCANCGINVEDHIRKSKKRRYLEVIAVAVICLGGLFAVTRFYRSAVDPSGPIPPERAAARDEGVQRRSTSGLKPHQVNTKGRLSQEPSVPAPAALRSPQSASPSRDTARPAIAKGVSPAGPSGEKAPTKITAADWFEKGRALDDDSDAELRAYLNAVLLEPKFAPAHYRLGALYFRRGDYDLADRAFGRFLSHATEEEKRQYDIHVFYSPAEAEDLTPEEEEKETSGNEKEAPAGKEVLTEQTDTEQEEELKAVVDFTSLRGHIRVPVLLNESIEADMMLDTGAGITLLSQRLALRLGIEPEAYASRIHLKTIGQDLEVPVVRLNAVRFGGVIRKNFPVAISDLNLGDRSFDGILGMDFLSGFDIRINHSERTILISTRPSAPIH